LLCYRDISTSGSLFHALSVSTPVVAPRLGTIPSYLFDGFNGYLYAPADETSCMQAIKRILAGQEAAQLRPGAAKSVAHLQWHLTLAKILQKVAS
jgi:glycosyltransferase involved in cell wall biosynthesis